MRLQDTPWTEELCERLRTLWADGWSTSQIGRELGVSRNAVIGKVNRLRLPKPVRKQYVPHVLGGHYHYGTSKSALYRRKVREKAGAPAPLRSAPLLPPPLPPEPVENTALRVSFMDLEPHHCRWPIGTPGEFDFMYCGDMRLPMKPYCQRHYRMAYNRHVVVDPSVAAARYRRMAKMRAEKKKVAA